MKVRNSFVSNSSSSSFIVIKCGLSPHQIELLLNIEDEYFKQNPWKIEETEFLIEGYTSMDNFCMSDYMEKIGIDVAKYVRFF